MKLLELEPVGTEEHEQGRLMIIVTRWRGWHSGMGGQGNKLEILHE